MAEKWNNWHIQTDENGDNYTAMFGPDDFESWWSAGAGADELFPESEIDNLFNNCVDLAEAEKREMTQSAEELRNCIETWVREWNDHIERGA